MSKKLITVEVDDDVKKALLKRAKRQYFSLRELISDILRRSVISSQRKYKELKTEEAMISIFSRSRRGRKKRKRKKK